MIVGHRNVTQEMLSAADVILAVNPAQPLVEHEVFRGVGLNSDTGQTVRMLIVLLDTMQASEQLQDLCVRATQMKTPVFGSPRSASHIIASSP